MLLAPAPQALLQPLTDSTATATAASAAWQILQRVPRLLSWLLGQLLLLLADGILLHPGPALGAVPPEL